MYNNILIKYVIDKYSVICPYTYLIIKIVATFISDFSNDEMDQQHLNVV